MLAIRHELLTFAPASEIFSALTEQKRLRLWLTPDVFAEPVAGSNARVEWQGYGWTLVVEITKLEPGRLVEWRCIDSNVHGSDAWIDSVVRFEIQPQGEKTSRLVCSQNVDEEFDLWKQPLASLKEYLETGIGHPYRS
ncbi:MAG: SRPBCC domain-containing protein [Deltaproteobacteria bacterium]|nr:SRPBCC domain-containing protein [Deltaproteobacteria bacterium]